MQDTCFRILVDSASLFAVWASGWEATPHQSFGYNRLEVLGALFSVQLIWAISDFLIYEAVGRLHHNAKVNGMLMFAIAAFGFVVNFIMVVWLGHDHMHSHHHGCGDSGHDHHHGCGDTGHDHSHAHHHGKDELFKMTDEEDLKLLSSSQKSIKALNINLQGAYLHVMTDLIQSVGVMIAGAIIWAKPEWLMVDLMCTLIFCYIIEYYCAHAKEHFRHSHGEDTK